MEKKILTAERINQNEIITKVLYATLSNCKMIKNKKNILKINLMQTKINHCWPANSNTIIKAQWSVKVISQGEWEQSVPKITSELPRASSYFADVGLCMGFMILLEAVLSKS